MYKLEEHKGLEVKKVEIKEKIKLMKAGRKILQNSLEMADNEIKNAEIEILRIEEKQNKIIKSFDPCNT